ncbi:MAG: outer membrane beta-barrel protein [Legionella sp.]|nr:outer membrane beta-barrel protein [Legionella sp.]
MFIFKVRYLILLLLANTAWAHTAVINLSGGMASAKVGQSQTLTMPDDYTTYRYTANPSSVEKFIYGIFVGTHVPVKFPGELQLGVSFYQPDDLTSGKSTLTQGVDAATAIQIPYNYKVKNKSLLIEARLLGTIQDLMHPYFSLGIGAAFNTTSDYAAHVPQFLTFTPEFKKNSITNFSYAVGAGIEIDISKNTRLGVGYRLADIGKANLGEAVLDDAPFKKQLKQSNLYYQAVFGQFTWILGTSK